MLRTTVMAPPGPRRWRRLLRPAGVAVAVAATFALPAAASADASPQNLVCNTTPTNPYYSGTYGNVIVPPNGNCLLSNSTVYGNVIVQSNGSIEFENNGIVYGSLQVGDQGFLTQDEPEGNPGWTFVGPLAANNAGQISIGATTHALVLNNVGYVTAQSANILGNFTINGGQAAGFITSSHIAGHLVMNATTGAPPGPLGASPFEIDGSPGVAPQDIDGNVLLTNNTQQINFDSNHVHRALVCTGNNPPPEASGNQVDGGAYGQCANATNS